MAYQENYGATAGLNQAPPKPTTVQSILEGMDPALARLEGLIGRVANSADRISGQRPPNDKAEGLASPEPNHLIWAAQARRDRLSRAVEFLETEITRIENGLA